MNGSFTVPEGLVCVKIIPHTVHGVNLCNLCECLDMGVKYKVWWSDTEYPTIEYSSKGFLNAYYMCAENGVKIVNAKSEHPKE
jgi:hypothetical protein